MTAVAEAELAEFDEYLAFKERRRAQGLRSGYKHDATVPAPTTGYAHGPGGMLTYPGVDPDVFSTIVGDLPGVINELPAIGSLYMNPTFEIITGVQAGSGAEPTEDCDPAPIGGLMKGNIVYFPFGKYQRATREIDINRLGQRDDRADPVDLRLVNSPMGRGIFGGGIDNDSIVGDPLTNEMDKVFFERAIEFHRLLSRQIWRGNPASNPTNGHLEFSGLELMIQQTWVDSITNAAAPSLYPDVKNFALKRVDSNGPEIINNLTYIVRVLADLAERSRVMPVRWAFAMRPNLFYELTKVWPCSYLTSVCALIDNGTNQMNVSAGEVVGMRDDMRNGRYLLIDGARIPVILDDGITEYTNTTKAGVTSGCFSSDIFYIPFSVLGGRAVTYFEYFQYSNPSVSSALADNLVLARALANGAFLETVVQTRWCTQWQAKIEPRLVFRTPWLSGRLQNVQYCPLQVPRAPFPDDPYWVNGGYTTRDDRTLYRPF